MLPLANGRCKVHGGLTPRKDDWHKPVWPDGRSPRAEEKLRKKLKTLERRHQQRTQKLGAMSDGERNEYQKWLKSHRPGSSAARAIARRERETAEHAKLLMARPDPLTADPELIALEAQIARLKAEIGDRKAKNEQCSSKRRNMKKNDTVSTVKTSLQERLVREAHIAVDALQEVAADSKSSPQARSSAGSALLRAAGLFDAKTAGEEKEPHEMTAAELAAKIASFKAALSPSGAEIDLDTDTSLFD
jgi:hypothetical protein